MSPTVLNYEAAQNYGPPTTALLNALHDALVSERRLLDDLIAQMRRQRAAVSGDDIQGVDDSTFATHRILATLGQARQRRRQLNLLLGGSEDLTLRDLEQTLGDQIDTRLREARQRLQLSADLLAREVGMNRKLLREALNSGDQYVRTLVGVPAELPTYDAEGPAAPATNAPRGLLVNRRA
jgi:AraC-like DNA-binding protein